MTEDHDSDDGLNQNVKEDSTGDGSNNGQGNLEVGENGELITPMFKAK